MSLNGDHTVEQDLDRAVIRRTAVSVVAGKHGRWVSKRDLWKSRLAQTPSGSQLSGKGRHILFYFTDVARQGRGQGPCTLA
eukprot:CAMPEP_0194518452 /NCGR_PEP_ID=MMETSP0253-20130528/51872_1 /TAXON_ID=2966 /ORGANISM="Noctiluca scintillans" /LENGTH=80 /DNA_ID=CAMNT_0039362497 /DNA_START=172 /DNA_END=411 /DNA_ORIENTATION=-